MRAVAARSPRRAARFAARHRIPAVYADYEQLVAAPDVDAIYIPLANGLHGEWARKALLAGKHVLCEKPLAANAAEAEQLADIACRCSRVLMEAMHYRYHPLIQRLRDLVSEMGEVRRIDASFCIFAAQPRDFRFSYDMAGGAMMDLGIYLADMLRLVAYCAGIAAITENPAVTDASAARWGERVDRTMRAGVRWQNGTEGRLLCSLLGAHRPGSRLDIHASSGRLRVHNPVLPHRHNRIEGEIGGRKIREHLHGEPTYVYQLRAFAAKVAAGTGAGFDPDLQNSLATMRLVDSIYLAAGMPLRQACDGRPVN